MAAEGPGEHCVAGKSHARRDSDDWLGPGEQAAGRSFKPESKRVLLRRFTRHGAERAMEVKWRPSGARRERIQRHILIEAVAQVSQHLQDFPFAWHRRLNDR
jgi:hypothetical protein